MKKILTALIAAACIAVACAALPACDLLTAPKVRGCTYEYESTDCDMSSLGSNDKTLLTAQLTTYRNNIYELDFSEEGTVTVTSSSGATKTYSYTQVGTNVIVPGGPNKNTKYNGDTVLGFTVSNSYKDILKWTITLVASSGTSVDVSLNYVLASAEGESV